MTRYRVVFITAPPGRAARKIAEQILKKRLAACVNIVPAVASTYWWKGKLERAKESLLIVKTRAALLPRLTAEARRAHPYTVPEVIALPIVKGHKPYLDWLGHETIRRKK